ncbi:MAG: Lrp/AsnC family transcriptional regulator [Firmicutes bacterium HGW-Firmicutes-15]|nr:MAG: Lrp/AsnC family transcriptional regulator [Firmicutes bacterium HGW-Firmicutes-15]
MNYDEDDRKILKLLQGDLPVESRPFRELAQAMNLSEEDIIDRVQNLQQKGTIRRWGAVLRHQQAGFTANAMVAWKVGAEQGDEAGNIMAGFKEISHCYLREVPDEFGYNMFSMIHARSDQELRELIDKVLEQTGLTDYIVIKSLRELKKASMEYIRGED